MYIRESLTHIQQVFFVILLFHSIYCGAPHTHKHMLLPEESWPFFFAIQSYDHQGFFFLAKFCQICQNLTTENLSLQNVACAVKPAQGTLIQKKSPNDHGQGLVFDVSHWSLM